MEQVSGLFARMRLRYKMSVKGVVLAGGKSTRFGEDKALAKLDGKTLLENTVDLMRQVDLEPVVVTSAARNYSFLTCSVLRDRVPEKGPLGGVYTACESFKDTSLLILTCDMPFLTSQMLKALLDHHDRNNDATLFHVPRRLRQPFPGIYESRLASLSRYQIRKDKLSMCDFVDAIPTVKVIESEFATDLFININERRDLALVPL